MAGPLSVEDILAKQKAEKEAAAKPKFLSKAERGALALEKRNADVKVQQDKDEVDKRERIAFEQAAEDERRRTEAARYGGGDRYDRYGSRDNRYGRDDRDGGGGNYGRNDGYGRDRYNGGQNGGPNGRERDGRYNGPPPHSNGVAPNGPRGNAPPSGPRSMQNGQSSRPHAPHTSSPLAGSSTPHPSSPKPNTPGDAALPTDAELSTIRARYLGQKTVEKKPRLRKEADKRNIFDWKAEEDTSERGSTWVLEAQRQGQGQGGMLGGRLVGFEKSGNGEEDAKYADALEKRRAGRGNTDERHWSDKPLDEMKDRDWRIFREDFSISARGGSIPLPLRNWRESNIPEKILDVIDEVGYTEPSPIQRQAIPIGMTQRDLIGIAQTGSGKTAAFVIPMLHYIEHLPPLTDENRHRGPYALILAPTRELAQQIEGETAKFASRMGYLTVSIIGGRAVEEQQFALRNGAEIVIATPGRLKDMLEKSMLVLGQCRYVILDECDRMVDLGFEADLTLILDNMNKTESRVTTLFSATMPPVVQRLAMKYLQKPATVTIGNVGDAVDSVEQRVEFVQGEEKKKNRLIEVLRSGFPPPIIVFVNQKKTAEMVAKFVIQAGQSVTTLHSDRSQAEREASLQSLRDGNTSVLVATDVAGRGIDVPDVSLIINYQMASTITGYIHRVGRSGRAGKLGTAITFLSNDDDEVMYDLKQEIERSPISKMNPELARHEAAKQRVTREMKRKRDEMEED